MCWWVPPSPTPTVSQENLDSLTIIFHAGCMSESGGDCLMQIGGYFFHLLRLAAGSRFNDADRHPGQASNFPLLAVACDHPV